MLHIGELYNDEEQLKGYDPDSRLAKRQELVKPYLDAFYKFIEEIDVSSSILSGKLKDAIAYTLNQKALLSRFLEDGNIPIDNGSAERAIRGIAIGRRNWLFCNTVTGAETSAILYSIVETASANGADIYTYLRYLLETMPRHLDDHDKSFLEDMLP